MRGLYSSWSELPYEEAVSALQEDALFVAASCWGERFYQALRSRLAGDQGRHKRVLFSFEIYQDQHAASVRTRFDALEGIEDLAMLYDYMSGQLQRGAALAQRMDDFVTQGRPLGFLYALWTWLMLGHVERAHETLGRWRQQHTFYQESPSTQALLLALEASIHSAAHSYHQEERILAQACALIQGTIHGQLYWSLEVTRRGAHMLWRGVWPRQGRQRCNLTQCKLRESVYGAIYHLTQGRGRVARGYCERGLKLPRASVDHPTRLHLLFLRALSGDKTQLSSDLEELQHAYPQEGVWRDWIQTLQTLVEQRRLEALRKVTVEAMTHRGPVQLPLIRYFHMNAPVDHDVCWDGRSDTFYAFGRLVELGQKPALSRLLKVMLQAPGQRMKIEQLRASLWPESVADPSNRLKVNAHRLRQELRAPKGVMLLPLQREELALASSPLSVFYDRPDQGVTPLK